MESKNSSFRAAVVNNAGGRHCSCKRGDAYHSAMLGRDHGGQKFLGQPEMGQYIYIERTRNGSLGSGENWKNASYARVVEEEGWLPELVANGSCCCRQSAWRGNVAVIEMNVGG